ncbi:hypothetical protein T265_11324 [Opisthorchis viverrini]|uniref:Uncharacterized protein n=1 Tax=Opisthorchis viverrini TaxID=6198 RepID=A0A074Z3E8_OPIVI|nr:hypothetical protein T265_11324 [Opisthorchis viverrini]KER20042.1 hypothetical protein T265_11324 [Opisthorchis viverrini]
MNYPRFTGYAGQMCLVCQNFQPGMALFAESYEQRLLRVGPGNGYLTADVWRVRLEQRINIAEVRRVIFGRNNWPTIDELITFHGLCWLDHVLPMPVFEQLLRTTTRKFSGNLATSELGLGTCKTSLKYRTPSSETWQFVADELEKILGPQDLCNHGINGRQDLSSHYPLA